MTRSQSILWVYRILILGGAFALSACGGGGGEDDDGDEGGATYTVGGTVSGLSGGMTLRLNGANDLIVNASGTFTFTGAPLTTGTNYSVTIFARPSAQVCNVTAGGSGTMPNANITNVAVSCTSYSIGGTISGLTGSGLVLQANGANDLIVPALSSSFVFPSSAAATNINNLYSVHIKSQPAGQTCTIVKSSGFVTVTAPTITGANAPVIACINNVTDAFSGTYKLQGTDPGSSTRAFVSFNPDGTFILGVRNDDATCAANNGNGVNYGVYNWNQSTQVIRIVNRVLDTTGDCGLDVGSMGTLTKNSDGTLSFIETDSSGPHEGSILTPVPSTAGELIGSWGDNQAFIVYEGNSKFFAAMTRAIVQNTGTSPGIEDGCYSRTGTTAGTLTFDVSSGCTVGGKQALDNNGPVGLSQIATIPLSFTVTGDSMQLTANGVNVLPFIPGTRILPSSLPSSYSISATISGLTAAGLILQNNGASSASVAPGSTSATIATGIANNTTYFVAVRSQPTGQYCTVTNGTGIVFANVSNVAVSCATISPTTYTIGGSITGLTGTGLALRLNGQVTPTFNFSPAAGATSYAFGEGLQTGTPYAIAVTTQPAGPSQFCFVTNNAAVGTIGTSNVAAAINCVASAAYTIGGSVSGLTSGLSLRMTYFNAGTATTVLRSVSANATSYNFTDVIPANGLYDVGIVTQPVGQTCTIIRGRGIGGLGGPTTLSNVNVACVNNTTDPLSGTYSIIAPGRPREYVNFNADGTFTTAFIHNDWRCNTGNDIRNGNGVEYGVFSWTQSTGAFRLATPAVVDSNGSCGLNEPGNFTTNSTLTISRIGNTIEIREPSSGPLLATATAVESNPSSLVGAFVREDGNGELLVFHSDGTFVFVDVQGTGLFPLGYGQERGCYTVSGSTVTLTVDSSCRPDGLAAYDFNASGGFLSAVLTTTPPIQFTITNATTLAFNGRVWKRTQPN